MTSKVCIVTGANSGIGKETAVQLAEKGARVVMVCRNRERGEPALAEIKAKSGNEDLESQQQPDQPLHEAVEGFYEEPEEERRRRRAPGRRA